MGSRARRGICLGQDKGCFRRKVGMTGEGIDRLVVRRKPREHVPYILSIFVKK